MQIGFCGDCQLATFLVLKDILQRDPKSSRNLEGESD